MRQLLMTITGLVVWLAFAASAQAKLVEYLSPHPVPHKYGGGFCTIEVAHMHNYAPDDPRMYRDINGQVYFVGDPTPFHYEGPRYAYYGAHPVVDAEVHFGHPIYCYMKGPHYHWYQPPSEAQFQFKGGAYWYVGGFPQAYYDERPRYAVVNEAYAPVPYVRPMVDIHVAPAVVQAEVSIGGPGWRASAMVGGPALPLLIPPVVPVPVAAFPVPVPIAPVPVGVGIGGAAVFDGRYHHDHGRHEGWRGPEPLHEHGHGPPSRFFARPAPGPARPFRGQAPMGTRGPAHAPGKGNRHH